MNLELYHNQPVNHNSAGILDFSPASILDARAMTNPGGELVVMVIGRGKVTVKNWMENEKARMMVFMFSDTTILR